MNDLPAKVPQQSRLLRAIMAYMLGCVAILVFCLLLFRPDSLAALTVIPAECWWIGGLILQLCFLCVRKSRGWQLATVIWIAFLFTFIEPVWSLPRILLPVAELQPQQTRLRIVSLNCEVGSRAVLQDLIGQQPDLVLLQESPGQAVLQTWVKELYGENGSVLWGRDCSILARGQLVEREIASEAAFVTATWKLPTGEKFDVVSLRLWPQPFRIDYWNPECWQGFFAVRKIQREQMDYLKLVTDQCTLPLIVGGDFNCPPQDPAEYSLQASRLRDAWGQAGRGWGKTITNGTPFHRIDRIWLAPELSPVNVQAIRTVGSDHRLLLCEVDLLNAK